MKGISKLDGMFVLALALSGCSKREMTYDKYIMIGDIPQQESTVKTNAAGAIEVIHPVYLVSAVGSATFYNDEKLPRRVSMGGSSVKYSGEALDVNADGHFDSISKRHLDTNYSLSDLEGALRQVSDAIVAGKESVNLR